MLTQSAFIPGTSQAITGNTEGSGIVWEDITAPSEGCHGALIVVGSYEYMCCQYLNAGGLQTEPQLKKPLKLMKLHDSPLTVVTTTAK